MALLYYPEVYSKSNEWGTVQVIKPGYYRTPQEGVVHKIFSVEDLEGYIGGPIDFQQIGDSILVYAADQYDKKLPVNSRATSISIEQGDGYIITGRAIHILDLSEVDIYHLRLIQLGQETGWR